jgi:hypothetical protein
MTNFRPLGHKTSENFEDIKAEFKNLTGKKSANKALNFAVNIAADRLEKIDIKNRELQGEKIDATHFQG